MPLPTGRAVQRRRQHQRRSQFRLQGEIAAMKTHRMLINGRWVDSASGECFESVNPFTAAPWALVPRGDKEDVDRAVAAAKSAFHGDWRKLTPTARGALLYRLRDLVAPETHPLAPNETTNKGEFAAENHPPLPFHP